MTAGAQDTYNNLVLCVCARARAHESRGLKREHSEKPREGFDRSGGGEMTPVSCACCAGLRRFVRPRRVPVASSSRKLTLNLGSKLGVYIDTPPLYPNPIPHPVQWRFFLRQTLLAAAAAAGEHESAFHLRQVCGVHGRGCLKPTQ